MQKLFSAFPDGWPGIGLVLLRLTVALNAIIHGLFALMAADAAASFPWIEAASAVVVGVALLIGLLTPVTGVVTSIGFGLLGGSLILQGGASMRGNAFAAFDLAAVSIALALLGPGAYSLDARLFGRREIIIPEGRPPR